MSGVQRKLRIEVYDETGNVQDDNYRTHTIASVELDLPGNVEVPGERLIEGARLAYQHIAGADFQQVIKEPPCPSP